MAGQPISEALVIEGDQHVAQELMALLSVSGAFRPRVLPPDRALTAAPGWSGPDVVLVGLDGDRAQRLAYARRVQGAYPHCVIVGYTRNFASDVLAEAMQWGARRVLPYPFELAGLRQAIRDAREELQSIAAMPAPRATPVSGAFTPPSVVLPEPAVPASRRSRVIAVFSPKGGVGCSTLAANLAAALQVMGHPTALVDGNISFGGIDVFLELQPTRSLLQLVGDVDLITSEAVLECLVEHSTGLQVLLAPLRPEEGDSLRGEHMQRVLAVLNQHFRFTLVDTWPSYDERVLAVLEVADLILVPIGPELPAMKNLKSFLRVARLLNYDMSKILPVLMRANSVSPGHLRDLETFLDQPLTWRVVSDGRRATAAANTGVPFVLSARDAQISQNIFAIAKHLAGPAESDAEQTKKPRLQQVGSGRFWRR